MLLLLVHAAAGGPPSGDGFDPTPVLSSIGTALLLLGGQVLLRRQQKEKLIAEASDEVAQGAKTILNEYRQALERAQGEIRELRDRVAGLEAQLLMVGEDRDRIEQLRLAAITRLATVQARVEQLEAQLHALESVVERRKT